MVISRSQIQWCLAMLLCMVANVAAQDTVNPVQVAGQGPFLADGTRNSWSDQNSIVIWTRTTRFPEMLVDGLPFVSLSAREANALSRSRDPDELLRAQLPDGATLDQMFGACPGAAGRVRLSWFPEGSPDETKRTEWTTTDSESDFTAQWKLTDLKPGTQYTTIVEAQTTDGQPGASLTGSFRTAPAADVAKPLRFCVTTCHDFIRRDDDMNGHKIYPTMSHMNPDFLVHAGDI
ncbi:MAG: hypothetical protein KDA96_01145, partial [Planctomycetaceae bacterium]|nr:hypothetical protein [Planctomycetaceae bacterium]